MVSHRPWSNFFAALVASTGLILAAGVFPACAEEKAGKPAGEKPKQSAAQPASKARHPALTKPALAKEQAPEKFRVELDTTKGKIVLEVTRAWSPAGADRFYNLVQIGFFDEIAFFRVIDGFMAQFGIPGDTTIARHWSNANIKDDPVVESNLRGYITFAKTNRPNSRSTQFFINLADNTNLDRMGFSPFGKVVDGMTVMDEIHRTGEGAPSGPGPNQQLIKRKGNDWLKSRFPKIDYIESAKILD